MGSGCGAAASAAGGEGATGVVGGGGADLGLLLQPSAAAASAATVHEVRVMTASERTAAARSIATAPRSEAMRDAKAAHALVKSRPRFFVSRGAAGVASPASQEVTRMFDQVLRNGRAGVLGLLAIALTVAPAIAETPRPTTKLKPTTRIPLKRLGVMPRKSMVPPLTATTAQRLPISKSTNGTTLGRRPIASKRTASRPQDVADDSGLNRFCTERTVSEAAGEYTKIVLGNQSDKIYPGAIYTDNAVLDGSYNAPSNVVRKPYEIAISLFSAASTGSSYLEVQPSLGGVNDGVAQLMRRQANVVNPSSVSTEVSQIYSLDQLAFELQAGYQGYGVDLAAEFAYSNERRKRVIFAKLTQVYFSVVLNNPTGAALVSNPAGSLPSNVVYVNKVNYGRIGILKIESDYSAEQIEAALDFKYEQSSQRATVNAEVDYEKVLDESKITGFYFGGDATNGMTSITGTAQLDEFDAYVRSGLRLNTMVAPTPISYELKYLNDNATAAVNSTTTYVERNCESANELVVRLDGISLENVHKAVDGSVCPTERCNSDCGYAWGQVKVALERRKDGARVEAVRALVNGRPAASPVMWARSRRQPQRGITNYKVIADNKIDRIHNVGTAWSYRLDPREYAAGNYVLVVTADLKTNHKDNHIASLGMHGMRRPVTREIPLKKALLDPSKATTTHKFGSWVVGPFGSESNRPHAFRVHFTVEPSR